MTSNRKQFHDAGDGFERSISPHGRELTDCLRVIMAVRKRPIRRTLAVEDSVAPSIDRTFIVNHTHFRFASSKPPYPSANH
jgi:hypothetical protein